MSQPQRFAHLLSEIAREVTRRQTAEICCGGLTLQQFKTMRSIRLREAVTIGSLSAEHRVDLSTMSRNVGVLERNGYVARARHEGDGRVVLLKLTSKGRRALETLCCDERDFFRGVFERIAPKDRPRTLETLQDVCSHLRADGADAASCDAEPRRATP